jgi:hypothetical protein
MSSRCESILVSLLSVAKKHQKYYCYVSQRRILELLVKYHRMGISRRTLNRDLRWLEDNGYISRLRRIRVDRNGGLVFTSTLYRFKGKLFNWLNSLGSRVRRLFSWFRVPNLAHHQLTQKQASSLCVASSVENPVEMLQLIPGDEVARRMRALRESL